MRSSSGTWHGRITRRLPLARRAPGAPDAARALSVGGRPPLWAVALRREGVRTGRPATEPRAFDAILDAIGLPLDDGNPIRVVCGFAIDWRGVLDRRYIADLDDIKRQADETPWPVFITNQGSYVVHWNRAFELVWDVDVERDFPDPLSRSLLSGAGIARFTRCIVNYEETMSFFLGLFKGDPRKEQDLEQ